MKREQKTFKINVVTMHQKQSSRKGCIMYNKYTCLEPNNHKVFTSVQECVVYKPIEEIQQQCMKTSPEGIVA
jgi:hypothetical protein